MLKPAHLRFDDIVLQQEAQFSVTVTKDLVARFAKLSGDTNPLHTDDAYAKSTPFGECIVHGMLCASFFSRLVGMYLPGQQATYLSQKVFFRKPCRIGTTILVKGIVTHKVVATQSITVQTEVLDERTGELLVGGEAVVAVRT